MDINSETECCLYCKMNQPLSANSRPWSAATVGEKAIECRCAGLKQGERFKGRDQERDIQTRGRKNVWV